MTEVSFIQVSQASHPLVFQLFSKHIWWMFLKLIYRYIVFELHLIVLPLWLQNACFSDLTNVSLQRKVALFFSLTPE